MYLSAGNAWSTTLKFGYGDASNYVAVSGGGNETRANFHCVDGITISPSNSTYETIKFDFRQMPRFSNNNLGTITSVSDIETFLAEHQVSRGIYNRRSFINMNVGDFINIQTANNTYTCYIAGFDTEYGKGPASFGTHHITFIAKLGETKMNSTATTAGGYEGATALSSYLTTHENKLSSVLGTHLLSRPCCTTNTVSSGKASAASWVYHKIALPSETQIFGDSSFGNYFDTGEASQMLPIFNCINPSALFGRVSIWTRSVAGTDTFAICSYTSNHATAFANSSDIYAAGVFCIG